jgi:hypothetical protein
MKPERKLLCYSESDFNKLMDAWQWKDGPAPGTSVISIGSINEESVHRFESSLNVFNLDVDDVGPVWWEKEGYTYDDAQDDYFNHGDSQHSVMFNLDNGTHIMNFAEAEHLYMFIHLAVEREDDIIVHCGAGISRSQAVVRYILDSYPEINWHTRESNPCIVPNMHIVLMLKRVFYIKEYGGGPAPLPPSKYKQPVTVKVIEYTDKATGEKYKRARLQIEPEGYGPYMELNRLDLSELYDDVEDAMKEMNCVKLNRI